MTISYHFKHWIRRLLTALSLCCHLITTRYDIHSRSRCEEIIITVELVSSHLMISLNLIYLTRVSPFWHALKANYRSRQLVCLYGIFLFRTSFKLRNFANSHHLLYSTDTQNFSCNLRIFCLTARIIGLATSQSGHWLLSTIRNYDFFFLFEVELIRLLLSIVILIDLIILVNQIWSSLKSCIDIWSIERLTSTLWWYCALFVNLT